MRCEESIWAPAGGWQGPPAGGTVGLVRHARARQVRG